jgi:parallel beta-helix repeat protein
MMRAKACSIAVLIVLFLVLQYYSLSQLSSQASSTIRVSADYATIQEAINAANDGDTVFVAASTYYEHVVVNKSISLIGENRGTTIVNGTGSTYVVSVTVDDVVVNGFTVQNGSMSGILLSNCSNCRVENNIATLNMESGIRLENTSASLVSNNEIFNNGYVIPGLATGLGIFLGLSYNNTICSNHVYDNFFCGIYLGDSDSNFVCDNDMTAQHLSTEPYGIDIVASCNNVVHMNTVSNNSHGIWVWCSSWNTISNNNVSDNGVDEQYGDGIEINRSTNNTVVANHVQNNTKGIVIKDEASNNTVACNTIVSNGRGVYTHYSNSSILCKNNFINNKVHVSVGGAFPGDDYPDVNVWDNGAEGNYWSNFTGEDVNLDGIIDTPYILDIRNRDNFPLVEPWSETRTQTANWDGTDYNITTSCNSTIAAFSFSQPDKQVSFNLTGSTNTTSACNVTIPLNFMWGNFSFLINDVPQPFAIYQNATHTSIYFLVSHHSTSQIKIISTGIVPEFDPVISLLFLLATTAFLLIKRRWKNKPCLNPCAFDTGLAYFS